MTPETQNGNDPDVQITCGESNDQMAVKTLRIRKDTLSRRRIAKRRHDISNAVQSLKFMHELLLEGYRFNDSLAAEKIEFVGKAIETLQREETFVRSLLDV